MIATAHRVPVGAMTIEELGGRAGITTRTIRSYQTIGMLPGPRKVGRVGYYTDEHLERLAAIGRLMQRGFSLAAIAALFHAHEQGHTLSEVLGLAGRDPDIGGREQARDEVRSSAPRAGSGTVRTGVRAAVMTDGVIDLR